MLHLSLHKPIILLNLLLACAGCKKDSVEIQAATNNITSADARPGTPTTTPVPTICNYDVANTTLTTNGWALIFEDNFDAELPPKWKIWTGGAFNNELQYYQEKNLQVANGILAITAVQETVTGRTTPFDATPKTFNYTSGRIESVKQFSANANTPKVRMMARIKLATGYGMWPAFWSYGDPWPTQGEIDMVEARGQEPIKYQTNYFYGSRVNQNQVRNATGYITADANLTDCYHVYEMIWEQDKLTSILDGKVVEVKTSGGYIPSLFGKTEKITLNLAVGGAFFNNLDPAQIKTGTLYVDWVKVFTAN